MNCEGWVPFHQPHSGLIAGLVESRNPWNRSCPSYLRTFMKRCLLYGDLVCIHSTWFCIAVYSRLSPVRNSSLTIASSMKRWDLISWRTLSCTFLIYVAIVALPRKQKKPKQNDLLGVSGRLRTKDVRNRTAMEKGVKRRQEGIRHWQSFTYIGIRCFNKNESAFACSQVTALNESSF